MNFLLATNSLDHNLYEEKAEARERESKEMPIIDVAFDREINALLATRVNAELMNNAIISTIGYIQDHIDVSQLPVDLRRILNMWIRTESWYYTGQRTEPWLLEHGVSKFELCLRRIVTRKIKKLVFERLAEDIISPFSWMPDEDDLYYATRAVCNTVVDGWPTMGTELAKAALRWIKKHDEHVMDNESEDFMWIHPDTGEECYHLVHLPKPEEHDVDPEEHDVEHVLISLETLPNNFQHEPDWTCPICLEVGEGTTCVRTGCKHVFHAHCFEECKRAYLEQEENKTCCRCPLCRGIVVTSIRA